MKDIFPLPPGRAVKMSNIETIRNEIATRLREGEPTEKDMEEIANDYPQLVEENTKLKERVKKGLEGILKLKEGMEDTMTNMMKSQGELMKEIEEFHEKARETALKLLKAEMSLVLLRVENSELKKRLLATDPEWAELGEDEDEGGEDYEPDYEWLSELERNR